MKIGFLVDNVFFRAKIEALLKVHSIDATFLDSKSNFEEFDLIFADADYENILEIIKTDPKKFTLFASHKNEELFKKIEEIGSRCVARSYFFNNLKKIINGN